MRLQRNNLKPQVHEIFDQLINEDCLELEPGAREKLEKKFVRLLENYIDQTEKIESEAHQFLGEHDMNIDDYYKRVSRSLAKTSQLPLGSDALEWFVEQFETILLDDEGVIELFAETPQLTAIIVPHIKAMK